MLIHGFDAYRVYLSAPGDLVREVDAARAAISDVNGRDAMPRKILLVSVGLREEGQIAGYRAAVAENVRQATYFVQIFQDDWGPERLYRKIFHLATECRDDASLPMREVVICLKDAPHETDPQVLEWRKGLEERTDMRVLTFARPEDLERQLVEVCQGWVGSIADAAPNAIAQDNPDGRL